MLYGADSVYQFILYLHLIVLTTDKPCEGWSEAHILITCSSFTQFGKWHIHFFRFLFLFFFAVCIVYISKTWGRHAKVSFVKQRYREKFTTEIQASQLIIIVTTFIIAITTAVWSLRVYRSLIHLCWFLQGLLSF